MPLPKPKNQTQKKGSDLWLPDVGAGSSVWRVGIGNRWLRGTNFQLKDKY